jgi:hypothetical protein
MKEATDEIEVHRLLRTIGWDRIVLNAGAASRQVRSDP